MHCVIVVPSLFSYLTEYHTFNIHHRLRECFEITPLEGGGEKVSCKYCPDYQKTLRSKFNPTKSREHLTVHCPGVDDELKKLLLETSQKAKKEIKMSELMSAEAAVKSEGDDLGADHHHHALLLAKSKKARGKTRKSPAYLSFHSGDSNLVSFILCIDIVVSINPINIGFISYKLYCCIYNSYQPRFISYTHVWTHSSCESVGCHSSYGEWSVTYSYIISRSVQVKLCCRG